MGRTQGSSAGVYSLPWCPQEDPASEREGRPFCTKQPEPGGSQGHLLHTSTNLKPETTDSTGTLLLCDPSVSMS